VPINAVIAPTGVSAGKAMPRDKASVHVIKQLPNKALTGNRIKKLFTTNFLAICGTNKPTKPIGPAIAALEAVNSMIAKQHKKRANSDIITQRE